MSFSDLLIMLFCFLAAETGDIFHAKGIEQRRRVRVENIASPRGMPANLPEGCTWPINSVDIGFAPFWAYALEKSKVHARALISPLR